MAAVAEEFDRRENRTGVNAPTFQFMRTGYFCMDNRDCTAEHLVFNRSVSLKGTASRSKEELFENNEGPEVTDSAFTVKPLGGYFFRFSSRITVITAPNNTPATVQMTQLRSGGTSGGSFSRKAYSFSPQDRNSATATSRAHSPVEVR